jgi:tetratricopeptide (TPR) repeat protein
VFADQGYVDDAIEIMQINLYRDRGFSGTHISLVELLAKERRVDQLRARADAGDHLAACRLGKLLAEQGLVDDAITLLREHSRAILQDYAQGLSSDVLEAAEELADLLAQQGRIDELQERTDAGDVAAAQRLADLLADLGRVDEAVTILGRLADDDDSRSAYRLDKLLADHGRADELRLRAEEGDQHATDLLLDLLSAQGRVDELRVRAELGDGEAARRLVDLLVGRGRVDEAIAILQIRANLSDWYAATRLPKLLDRQD